MRFEWREKQETYKVTHQLVYGDTALCEIEQTNNEDFCYLWEGQLDFLFSDINSSFDFVEQAKCEVENRLRAFCVAYNTWWQRENKN